MITAPSPGARGVRWYIKKSLKKKLMDENFIKYLTLHGKRTKLTGNNEP